MLKFTLSLTNPDDLKVRQGDYVEANQVFADRTRQQQLRAQRDKTAPSLQRIESQSILNPPPPLPIPPVKVLPDASYAEQEAAIVEIQSDIELQLRKRYLLTTMPPMRCPQLLLNPFPMSPFLLAAQAQSEAVIEDEEYVEEEYVEEDGFEDEESLEEEAYTEVEDPLYELDDNPLNPTGDSLDLLIQSDMNEDLRLMMMGDLSCLEPTAKCIGELQATAVENNLTLQIINERVATLEERIDEA